MFQTTQLLTLCGSVAKFDIYESTLGASVPELTGLDRENRVTKYGIRF